MKVSNGRRLLVRLAFLVLLIPVAPTAASQKAVEIENPIRLHSWLMSSEGKSRLEHDLSLNWLSKKQELVDKQIAEEIIEFLSKRSLMAAGDPFAALRLKGLIESLPYFGRVALPSTDSRWLEVNPEADPILLPGDRIISYARPSTVTVVLSTGRVCSVTHQTGRSVQAYLDSCLVIDSGRRSRTTPSERAWLAQPDGRIFVAFVDRQRDILTPEPAPGAWIWSPRGWLESEGWFSSSLIRLFASQGPAGDYIKTNEPKEPSAFNRAAPKHLTNSQLGGVGLVQMPSARMRPEGTLSTSLTLSPPYRRVNIMVQAFPWLEYGLRYTNIRNRLYGPIEFSGDRKYVDKSLDLKFRLFEETELWPQMAIGMIDAVGTGLFSSEYFVATKRFGSVDVSSGLFFGKFSGSGALDNPVGAVADRFDRRRNSNQGLGGKPAIASWFTGPASPFIGFEWAPPNLPDWTVKVEYTANNSYQEPYRDGTLYRIKNPTSRFNYGVTYKLNDWVGLGFGVERGYQLVAGINLHTSINKKPIPKYLDSPPLVVNRLDQSKNLQDLINKPDQWTALVKELEKKTLWKIQSISRSDSELTLTFLKTEGVYVRDRIDLIGRVLTNYLDNTVRRFIIYVSSSGLDLTTVVIDRERFVQDKTELLPPIEKERSPAVTEIQPTRVQSEPSTTVYDGLKQRNSNGYAWGNFSGEIGGSYSHLLGGPTGYWLFQLGLRAHGEWRPAARTWFDGAINLRLLDNYNDLYNNPKTGDLPEVRTRLRDYLKTPNPITIPHAQWTHVGKMAQVESGHFYSIYGGLLETMFGGLGAEYLYRPWHSRTAFGIDINHVRQRDYNQWGTLQGYEGLSGHLTGYWMTGWNGVTVKAKAGQYLAGDVGVTLDLSRRFSSGAVIGALATKTNVSSAGFGEGSFDKLLYLRLPFDLLLPKRSNSEANFLWRNITSNAGAILNRRHSLFELTDKRDPRTLIFGSQ